MGAENRPFFARGLRFRGCYGAQVEGHSSLSRGSSEEVEARGAEAPSVKFL